MGKVGVIGVGQTAFVRGYPGSIRELAFDGFREALKDADISAKDMTPPLSVRPPNTINSDLPRESLPSTWGLRRNLRAIWRHSALPAAWDCDMPIRW